MRSWAKRCALNSCLFTGETRRLFQTQLNKPWPRRPFTPNCPLTMPAAVDFLNVVRLESVGEFLYLRLQQCQPARPKLSTGEQLGSRLDLRGTIGEQLIGEQLGSRLDL